MNKRMKRKIWKLTKLTIKLPFVFAATVFTMFRPLFLIVLALWLASLTGCGQAPASGSWGPDWTLTVTVDGIDYGCRELTPDELSGTANNCGSWGTQGACKQWWTYSFEQDGSTYGCKRLCRDAFGGC